MKKIPIRKLSQLQQGVFAVDHFKIRRVEDIIGENGLFHDLHRHDFFFILALQNGRGFHEIDFISYKLSDKVIFFLWPGQVHQLELKAGCSGYLIEFNTEFYQPSDKSPGLRLKKAGNKNYYKPGAGRYDKIQRLLALVLDEYNSKEGGYQDIIRSSLDIFFTELVRLEQGSAAGKEVNSAHAYTQERFEEFLELLDRYIVTHKQVAHYTALMNLSSYQLNEITKTSIGKTASELINEHILLEAKRYLLATPNQVKDIAGLLGYEDTSYFIRFFKKHIGHSPEVFRSNFK
ncbi:MAG: helix-turn-helix domain-containing protein [Ferruginibacter sp.]